LKLELDRQDNDKRIATLYLSMSAMLVILAKLDSVFNEEGDLSDLLDRKLDDIVNLLNDFGNFCDVYYKHRTVGMISISIIHVISDCRYNPVRFLRITRYNDLINDFAESFISTRQELETLILNHTTLVVMQTSNTVNLIARELSELTQFMNTQTTREREAQDLIKAKGGVEKVVKVSVWSLFEQQYGPFNIGTRITILSVKSLQSLEILSARPHRQKDQYNIV
jgi:hypothetical protein